MLMGSTEGLEHWQKREGVRYKLAVGNNNTITSKEEILGKGENLE